MNQDGSGKTGTPAGKTQAPAGKVRLPLLGALRSPAFRLLWLGQTLSVLGDFVSQVGILVIVYQVTGSGTAVGALFLVQVLPTLILAPFAGVVADRYDRRRVMIAADLVRGLAVAVLVLFPSLPAVYAVSAVIAAISTFFSPARGALVPRTVPPENLLAANSLSAMSNSVTRILGAAVGATLVAAFGAAAAFSVNALSYFASALCLTMLRLPRTEVGTAGVAGAPGGIQAAAKAAVATAAEAAAAPAGASDRPGGDPSLRSGRGTGGAVREGLVLLWRNPRLAGITLLVFFNTLGLGAANVLTAPLVQTTLGANTSSLGWLMSAEGVGTAVGVVLLGGAVRAAAAGWAVLISSAVLAATMLGLAVCGALWQAVGLFLLGGVGLVAFNVSAETETQRATTDAIRGRILSLIMAVLSAGSLLSLIVGGILADLVGVRISFAVMGLLIATGCVVYAGPLARVGREKKRAAASQATPL